MYAYTRMRVHVFGSVYVYFDVDMDVDVVDAVVFGCGNVDAVVFGCGCVSVCVWVWVPACTSHCVSYAHGYSSVPSFSVCPRCVCVLVCSRARGGLLASTTEKALCI